MLQAPALDLPGVAHAFSEALTSADEERAFLAAAVPAASAVLRLRQVHGATVVAASAALAAADRLEGDALIGDEPGVAMIVATADCVPVLLADPAATLVAAVHAGWRGMRARILARTLDELVRRGARPERIRAGIGPAVQGGCYQVGAELRSEFEGFPGAAALFAGDHLDLIQAARAELALAGVAAGATSVVALCTHCEPALASHRRQGKARGTNLSVIALAAG